MKKLMIAAAAAAMIGGAYADLCDEVLTEDGCALYDVKFKFKTLAAKDARCSATEIANLKVSKPALFPNGEIGLAYLDNATRTFDGILWQCKTACFEGVPADQDPANNGAINFALWEKKTDLAVSPKIVYTAPTANTPANWASADESPNFKILGRYGKSATKVTAYWTPSINTALAGVTIDAAGFGSWNNKTGLIKSLSGNAVGKLIPVAALSDGTLCTDGTALSSVLAYMCSDFRGWCCGDCVATSLAPASGTWSLKYNSKKSKSGKLSQIIPAYMR